jgi:hypothetical protein
MNILIKNWDTDPNIFHFKAFGMMNLHHEVRICQKIYDRVTMTVYVKGVVWFNVNKTLCMYLICQDKFFFEKQAVCVICGFFQEFLALFDTFTTRYSHSGKEFHGSLIEVPIDQARRPSTMAENRRFMNFFTFRYEIWIFWFILVY